MLDYLPFIRIAVYSWIIFETGTLASFFWILYKSKENDADDKKFILGLFFFSASCTAFFFYTILVAFMAAYHHELYFFFVNGLLFPSLAIAFSTMYIKKDFKYIMSGKEEDRGKKKK